MSLRAGYYGLKKGIISGISDIIKKSSGAKWIKSFGDGLDLTDAGKLELEAATASKFGGVKVGEGLEITENGVLNVTVSGGADYSTDEVDTGTKWTDGKTIYRKVIHSDTAIASGTTLISGVEHVVNAYGSQLYSGGSGSNRWYNFPYGAGIRWELFAESHDLKSLVTDTGFSTCDWVFEYTKVTPAENNTRKKGGIK